MIEWMLESENRRNHEPKNVVLFVKKNQKTHRAQIGCDSLIVTWKQRGWRWWAAPVRAVRRAMGRRRRRAPTEPTLTKPTRRGRGCRRFCRRGRRRSPARAATTNTSSRTSRRLCPVAKKRSAPSVISTPSNVPFIHSEPRATRPFRVWPTSGSSSANRRRPRDRHNAPRGGRDRDEGFYWIMCFEVRLC